MRQLFRRTARSVKAMFCWIKKLSVIILLSASALSLSGCGTLGKLLIAMEDPELVRGRSSMKREYDPNLADDNVKPWERAKLNSRQMSWEPDKTATSASRYFKRSRQGIRRGTCSGVSSLGCR